MKILTYVLMFLVLYVEDIIMLSLFSRHYAKKCNYDCSKCKMWSCLNVSKYDNGIYIVPYDNYKNVCGKMGGIYFE